MTDRRSPFLESARGDRQSREHQRRVRRRRLVLLVVVVLAIVFGILAAKAGDALQGEPDGPDAAAASGAATAPPAVGQTALGPIALRVDLGAPDRFAVDFKRPPRAALVVDLDTGEVLWRRNAERALPIASVTKMMTAIVAAEALGPRQRVRITPKILNYTGSGMGVLPRGKRVPVEPLLYGLLLPSGNDAARALAIRTSGSLRGFVARMNAKAGELGLSCTRFASVEGLSPRNTSCPIDLAALARRVLDTPRLAAIVRRRKAILPFPIKGGKAYLYNHNPLLRTGYPGVIGVKTGYTSAAGRCLVAAVRRGGTRLGVVLLHSPDPGRQAEQLFDRAFRALT